MYCSLANTVMLVWFVNYINKARAGEYIEKEMFEAVPENVFNCVIEMPEKVNIHQLSGDRVSIYFSMDA